MGLKQSESSKLSYIEEELKIPKSKVISVSKLNDYIEERLTTDSKLIDVYLIGEVSNLRVFPSGHTYFNLKDEDSLVSCIIYAGNKRSLKYSPEDNKEVLVLASVSVYKKSGKYQLNVEQVFPIGEGLFHTRFRKLKERLEKKGMFDDKYKKDIPLLPKCIGIATSPTGAVIRDILDTLTNRFPNVNVIISPTIVQGENSPKSIINSIKELNKIKEVDTIILGRGGGSLEDLDCFNNEEVAKAIFKSKTPIISAIGHENDWTISDFVSDKRAITPTHSAELGIVNKKEEIENLNAIKLQLETSSKSNMYRNILITILVLLILYGIRRLFF